MCFSYPDEVEENRFMWCFGVVDRVNTRDDKVIKVYIKWDEQFFACGEIYKMGDILKKHSCASFLHAPFLGVIGFH